MLRVRHRACGRTYRFGSFAAHYPSCPACGGVVFNGQRRRAL